MALQSDTRTGRESGMKIQFELLIAHPSAEKVEITLRGDLDAHSVRNLDAALVDIIVDSKVWVVVDLSDVGYVSSAGVMRLLAAMEDARKVGGDVVLAGAQPQVRQVFHHLGLEDLLQFASGVPEAWKSMAKIG